MLASRKHHSWACGTQWERGVLWPTPGPPRPQSPVYSHTQPNTITLVERYKGQPTLHLDSCWLPHAQGTATGKARAYPALTPAASSSGRAELSAHQGCQNCLGRRSQSPAQGLGLPEGGGRLPAQPEDRLWRSRP